MTAIKESLRFCSLSGSGKYDAGRSRLKVFEGLVVEDANALQLLQEVTVRKDEWAAAG